MASSIYDIQQYTKAVFIVLAVIIAGLSFYVTHNLVNSLSIEEKARMEIWANATRELVSMPDGCDLTFVQEVISENTTIPVVLADTSFRVLSYRNLEKDDYTEAELTAIARSFAAARKSIVVTMDDGEKQYICYGNSLLLKKLAYFPIVQFMVVALYLILVVLVLLAMKRAEQNKVWVGLSKETAHQLGTPISSMLAWTEILKTKYPDDKMMFEMEKDVNRLRTIAERFSQIGSKTEFELVEINQLITKSLTYIRTRISKKVNIEFCSGSTYYVMINIPLFEWVIENLCKNAVDAMNGEGGITIYIGDKESNVFIDITDTGKGISKKNIKKVFNPGFTTKKRGWGLGLSLAHRIIEEYHKGKIYVKHSEINKGTTFRIELKKV
ncbi:MAG: HAMP domain-containing histidine kinase [Paludibacteraceae bacterium]|jgi:two-component system, sporulation sensor kinase D|nr:HAMP domain-containing histidine kinase [Paludibacteraceae bacterium]OQA48302.1 MAG: Sensor protein ZraS [Bacteroidetes bacterium ADurb.Bin302]